MPNKRLKLTGPAFRGSRGLCTGQPVPQGGARGRLRLPALAPQLKRDPLDRVIPTLRSTYIVRTLNSGADPRRMGPREGADQPSEAWRVLRGSGDGLL